MDRRTIIKQISFLTGAAFVGSEMFILTGCNTNSKPLNNDVFTADEISLLDEIGESILPTTDTPGAKSINIGQFIHKIVKECYTKAQKEIIKNGLDSIQKEFEQKYKVSFIKADVGQRTEYLNALNDEMISYRKGKKADDPEHYFLMMKQLTILGYFTSETGASQALNYIAVPGRYDGSYAYKKGDKAWATS